MTRCRIRPMIRERRIPTATKNAERPVRGTFARTSRSLNVFINGRAERATRFLHQVRLDEDVDVAVEDAVHVADLLLRSVTLHHLVRMEHVAADLAAEADLRSEERRVGKESR